MHPFSLAMDDFADVHDSALAFDIGNDSGEDSSHTGHDELQILQQPPQEAQSALEHSTPSQDRDFQSQVQVVVRSRAGAGQSLVPEPKPKNVETEVRFALRVQKEFMSSSPPWDYRRVHYASSHTS